MKVILEGDPYAIVDNEFVKPGKGQAFNRIKVRNLKNHGLEEGVSTRLLIYAGTLMREGVATERACDVAIARPITDDPDMQRSIMELVKAIF